MASPSPAERRLAAQLGAHRRWAQTIDRTAATQAARDGLQARFARQVDPDGVLSPEVRARNAESARRAYYIELALKSAQARRARRGQ